MHTQQQHVRFVVTWELAGSAEVAARVLGRPVESVNRTADWMRGAGVPLKVYSMPTTAKTPTAIEKPGPFDAVMQHSPTEEVVAQGSYVSLLKTDKQMAFFAKYTVGTIDKPSVAEAVAYLQASKSGDIGYAGLASGVAEQAAYEAVAQLAVAPPESFDPNHPRASSFVTTHIRWAVRTRLTKEYGTNACRFGGYLPTDTDGRVAEVDEGVNDTADEGQDEGVRQEQLARVRSLLPGGVPTEREDRFRLLRSLGEPYAVASRNAAESRFHEVLALHLTDKMNSPSVAAQLPERPDEESVKFVLPQAIRERMTMTLPTVSQEQRVAENFITVWETSGSGHAASRRLGWPLGRTMGYAKMLRRAGVTNLKCLPASPAPFVRGVLALRPSLN